MAQSNKVEENNNEYPFLRWQLTSTIIHAGSIPAALTNKANNNNTLKKNARTTTSPTTKKTQNPF